MKSDRTIAASPCGHHKAVLTYCARVACIFPRVHRDERGSISIITIIALMLFTVLLGMVVNVGRHVDDKVKQQNAADSATLSSGVVLARGMNSLAFSNHLLCEIFSLTAFMREARDRNAEALTPDILAAWTTVAPIFQKSPFSKFQGLGGGIPAKVEAEREMVKTYSDFAASISEIMLPTLEQILQQKLIPQFERSVIQSVPGIAQQIMGKMTQLHGRTNTLKPLLEKHDGREPDHEVSARGQTSGVLWRLNPQYLHPVAQSGESDPTSRTLPVVDPDPKENDYGTVPHADLYLQAAIKEREHLSRQYLNHWNSDVVGLLEKYAKMSQFYNLWVIFTYGQLCKLLNEEYPTTNLPFQIRRLDVGMSPVVAGMTPDEMIGAINGIARANRSVPDWRPAKPYLEYNFRFGGLAYRKPLREMFGKLFLNQQTSDAVTFSEVSLFLPEPRWHYGPVAGAGREGLFGGAIPADPASAPATGAAVEDWWRENWPRQWSLLTQNWTVQLVPATADGFAQVLQSSPGGLAPGVNVPSLGAGGSPENIRRVNTH